MKKAILTVLFFSCLTGLAQSQPQSQTKYWIYGQNLEERASTRIGYWRRDVNAGVGEVIVSYGRPPWKAAYETQLDQMTVGKMWRMGDNYWTLLDTNLPIKVAGAQVSPGFYYLAVERSQDGSKWELVFIDPVQSRSKGLDAYDVGTRPAEIPVLFKVPMEFTRSEQTVEKLTMLLKLDDGSETQGTLKVDWGNLSLTAPLEIALP